MNFFTYTCARKEKKEKKEKKENKENNNGEVLLWINGQENICEYNNVEQNNNTLLLWANERSENIISWLNKQIEEDDVNDKFDVENQIEIKN